MGSGNWSTDVHSARASANAAAGRSAFGYNDDVLAGVSASRRKIHERLNPYGVTVRESRDSDEHPHSRAIAVAFDVTGSMGTIPRLLQTKLPKLHGLIKRRGYITDPQIMFAAVGDSHTDMAPLQVGQFESDNRMDEDLEHFWLEGNGGGQMREGYEMMLYFLARKTALDCHEKRGERGYAFIIGDELAYPAATAANLRRILGDNVEAGIPVEQLVAEVQKRYELFFLMAPSDSYCGKYDEIFGYWKGLLGERAVELSDPGAVCETIALSIGLAEGTVGLDDGIGDLVDAGTDHTTAKATGRSLEHYARTRTQVAALAGGAPGDELALPSGSERL